MLKLRMLIFGLLLLFVSTLNHARIHQMRFFHLNIDSTFTEEQKEIIVKAAHRWERATNNSVVFEISTANTKTSFNPFFEFLESYSIQGTKGTSTESSTFIWNARSYDPQLMALEKVLGFEVLGFCPGNYMLIVSDRVADLKMEKVAIHELGHLIGLKHTSSVMGTDHESDSVCITEIDTQQYCRIYGCNRNSDVTPECLNGHL